VSRREGPADSAVPRSRPAAVRPAAERVERAACRRAAARRAPPSGRPACSPPEPAEPVRWAPLTRWPADGTRAPTRPAAARQELPNGSAGRRRPAAARTGPAAAAGGRALPGDSAAPCPWAGPVAEPERPVDTRAVVREARGAGPAGSEARRRPPDGAPAAGSADTAPRNRPAAARPALTTDSGCRCRSAGRWARPTDIWAPGPPEASAGRSSTAAPAAAAAGCRAAGRRPGAAGPGRPRRPAVGCGSAVGCSDEDRTSWRACVLNR
jgi:hypothetical protein